MVELVSTLSWVLWPEIGASMLVTYLTEHKNGHLGNNKTRQLSLILGKEAEELDFLSGSPLTASWQSPSIFIVFAFPHF